MIRKFYPIKLYLRSLPNLISLSLSVILNIAIWVWLLWQIRPQEEPIFLHYNILFGVDYVGAWWRIIFLPVTGLVIILFNATFGWLLYNRDTFIAYVLNTVSVLLQIFLLITASLLVFLNV